MRRRHQRVAVEDGDGGAELVAGRTVRTDERQPARPRVGVGEIRRAGRDAVDLVRRRTHQDISTGEHGGRAEEIASRRGGIRDRAHEGDGVLGGVRQAEERRRQHRGASQHVDSASGSRRARRARTSTSHVAHCTTTPVSNGRARLSYNGMAGQAITPGWAAGPSWRITSQCRS